MKNVRKQTRMVRKTMMVRKTIMAGKNLQVLLAGILLTAGMSLSAQLSLEYTYPVSASICKLEKAGDMYFTMDVAGNKCNIYDLKHNLYRSISLTVPVENYLYNIQHVSQHLFHPDDLIEFVYIYSKYTATETSYYYTYEAGVINENGTVLLSIPGAGHSEILETEEGDRKFLVYVYDFYQIPATTQTKVYGLPDQPEEPLKSGGIRKQHQPGNPWPNPSGGMVNIPVKLPPDVEAGELVLYNIHGQEVLREPVDGEEDMLIINGGVLIPGTYVYKLQHRKGESQAKKISIR